jgi:hypothetical protein
LEHRASNPVSVKNLTAIETSTIVKLLRPCVPVGTKRTRRRRRRRMHYTETYNGRKYVHVACLDKMIVALLVKKFSAFYGIGTFITVFTPDSH